MNYEEFKEKIRQCIQAAFTDKATVLIQPVMKNNGIALDALSVQVPEVNISPSIYLNRYYEEYHLGRSIDSIIADILELYNTTRPSESIDVSFFTDYDSVKERLAFKLINTSKNEELLRSVPHISYLDLSLVFYCLISTDENGCASILIHNNHLELWNISIETLYKQALQNTPILLDYELQNMTDLLSDLMTIGKLNYTISEEEYNEFHDMYSDDNNYPMYVLSNSAHTNGAGCILYEGLLKDFSEKMDADLFVLPSSIHEVIIIPAYTKGSIDELNQMVKDVNMTQVAEEEILSDHVYFFSRENNNLTLAENSI